MLNTISKITLVLIVCFCCGSEEYVLSHSSEWANKQAEIYFLLDSSSSVWIVDYQKQLKFVADLVADMDIGSSLTRVGVGIFSEDHHLYIPLNNPMNRNGLQNAISQIPKIQGNTYISRALKGMREEGLAPGITRLTVPLISVLLTDGSSRHKQLTADNATLAKAAGIFIFTVGIGNGVDREELRAIASDPKVDFNFHVQDFDHLTNIRAQLSQKMSEVDFLQGDAGTCGEHTKVDTVFVYDESAIGETDTKKIKSFIQSLAKDFSMNSGKIRVGVVSKTCHEGDIMLGQYVTKEDFITGIEISNGPEISRLVKRAREEAFLPDNGARLDAKKRIILVLHNKVKKQTETFGEMSRARYIDGVEVFVIRVGTDYDKEFIGSLATSSNHAFYLQSMDHLPNVKDEFLSVFCRDL